MRNQRNDIRITPMIHSSNNLAKLEPFRVGPIPVMSEAQTSRMVWASEQEDHPFHEDQAEASEDLSQDAGHDQEYHDPGYVEETTNDYGSDVKKKKIVTMGLYGAGAVAALGFLYWVFAPQPVVQASNYGSGVPVKLANISASAPSSPAGPSQVNAVFTPGGMGNLSDNPAGQSVAGQTGPNLEVKSAETVNNEPIGVNSSKQMPVSSFMGPNLNTQGTVGASNVGVNSPNPQQVAQLVSAPAVSSPVRDNMAMDAVTQAEIKKIDDQLAKLSDDLSQLNTKIDSDIANHSSAQASFADITTKLTSIDGNIENIKATMLKPENVTFDHKPVAGVSSAKAIPKTTACGSGDQSPVLSGYDLRGYSASAVVVGTPYGADTVNFQQQVPGAGTALYLHKYGEKTTDIELVTSQGIICPIPGGTS